MGNHCTGHHSTGQILRLSLAYKDLLQSNLIPAHSCCHSLKHFFTPKDHLCFSRPKAPRTETQAPKLITKGKGKLCHFHMAQTASGDARKIIDCQQAENP